MSSCWCLLLNNITICLGSELIPDVSSHTAISVSRKVLVSLQSTRTAKCMWREPPFKPSESLTHVAQQIRGAPRTYFGHYFAPKIKLTKFLISAVEICLSCYKFTPSHRQQKLSDWFTHFLGTIKAAPEL